MDKNYRVIGGQYEYYNYGFYDSLHAAKIAATKAREYWDNWQGWHKPCIYNAADCVPCKNLCGNHYRPKENAIPILIWDDKKSKWIKPEY